MQCPNCQHWNEAGSRFCEECGTELPKNNGVAPKVSVTGTASLISPPPPPLPPTASEPMVQMDVPDTSNYGGARLVLNSTRSIFKLGSITVIGRENPSVQIDFDGYPDGKYVSQRHAQIVKMDEKYYLEDLGSSNGTWVNDIRLAQGQAEPLDEGEVIRFGKLELTFHAT